MPAAVKRRYFELNRIMSFSAVRAGPTCCGPCLVRANDDDVCIFGCDRLLTAARLVHPACSLVTGWGNVSAETSNKPLREDMVF
jgi:hypothetical protein